MVSFENESINVIFKELGGMLLTKGSLRIGDTGAAYQMGPVHMSFSDINDTVLTIAGKGSNYWLMLAGFLHMVSGSSGPWLFNFSKSLRRYTALEVCYGDRMRRAFHPVDQFLYVLKVLHDVPGSRQAVITLWDPRVDSLRVGREVPCTIAFHLTRTAEETLDLTSFTRANDLMRGFPHDVFHCMMMQKLIAEILGIGTGIYHHIVSQFCLFRDDVSKFEAVKGNGPDLVLPRSLLKLEEKFFPSTYSSDSEYLDFIDALIPQLEERVVTVEECLLQMILLDLVQYVNQKNKTTPAE